MLLYLGGVRSRTWTRCRPLTRWAGSPCRYSRSRTTSSSRAGTRWARPRARPRSRASSNSCCSETRGVLRRHSDVVSLSLSSSSSSRKSLFEVRVNISQVALQPRPGLRPLRRARGRAPGERTERARPRGVFPKKAVFRSRRRVSKRFSKDEEEESEKSFPFLLVHARELLTVSSRDASFAIAGCASPSCRRVACAETGAICVVVDSYIYLGRFKPDFDRGEFQRTTHTRSPCGFP